MGGVFLGCIRIGLEMTVAARADRLEDLFGALETEERTADREDRRDRHRQEGGKATAQPAGG